jgi:hypothetical protein
LNQPFNSIFHLDLNRKLQILAKGGQGGKGGNGGKGMDGGPGEKGHGAGFFSCATRGGPGQNGGDGGNGSNGGDGGNGGNVKIIVDEKDMDLLMLIDKVDLSGG